MICRGPSLDVDEDVATRKNHCVVEDDAHRTACRVLDSGVVVCVVLLAEARWDRLVPGPNLRSLVVVEARAGF